MTKGPMPGKFFVGRCFYKAAHYNGGPTFAEAVFSHIKKSVREAGFDLSELVSVDFKPASLISLDNGRLTGPEFYAYVNYCLHSLKETYKRLVRHNKNVFMHVVIPVILGDAVLNVYEDEARVKEAVASWIETNASQTKEMVHKFNAQWTKDTGLSFSTYVIKFSDFEDTDLHKRAHLQIEDMRANDRFFNQLIHDTMSNYLSRVNQSGKKRTPEQATDYIYTECPFHASIAKEIQGTIIVRNKRAGDVSIPIKGFYVYPWPRLNEPLAYAQEQLAQKLVGQGHIATGNAFLVPDYYGYRTVKRNKLVSAAGELEEVRQEVKQSLEGLEELATQNGVCLQAMFAENKSLRIKIADQEQQVKTLNSHFKLFSAASLLSLVLIILLLFQTRIISGSTIKSSRRLDEPVLPPSFLKDDCTTHCVAMWQSSIRPLISRQPAESAEDPVESVVNDSQLSESCEEISVILGQ